MASSSARWKKSLPDATQRYEACKTYLTFAKRPPALLRNSSRVAKILPRAVALDPRKTTTSGNRPADHLSDGGPMNSIVSNLVIQARRTLLPTSSVQGAVRPVG